MTTSPSRRTGTDIALVAGFAALIAVCAILPSIRVGGPVPITLQTFAVLLSGVALRTYRAEYVFGFVLGMTFVFGAVLPTMVALVAGGVSALAHFVAYPGVAALNRRLRGTAS